MRCGWQFILRELQQRPQTYHDHVDGGGDGNPKQLGILGLKVSVPH